MRLEDQRESQNVEDRRGQGGGGFGRGFGGGGGGLGPLILIGSLLGRGRLGIGGIALLLVLAFCSGQFGDLGGLGGSGSAPTARLEQPAAPAARGGQASDAERQFVSRVLASTEDVWAETFRAAGREYRPPILVLYEDVVQSGCGTAQATTGPFYCPADTRLYIDLAFLRQMTENLGARGDFAWAYVIAHEVGHHVQNLLGTLPEVDRRRRAVGEREGNVLQVRLELQADCFAGVWANRARRLLEAGDVEEGLNAAAAVGDDRLQGRSGRRAVPDSFTHGSSAQRAAWLRRGLESGDPRSCDTFSGDRL